MARMILFSPVTGQVTSGGKPIVGATVTRTYHWHWNDSRGEDRAVTNAKGEFRFETLTGRSFFGSMLPHEPVISQKLEISVNGKTYKAWVFSKRDYEMNGELNGRPLQLHCNLEAPERRTDTNDTGQSFFGICELR